jgi:hypothetical protein
MTIENTVLGKAVTSVMSISLTVLPRPFGYYQQNDNYTRESKF